MIEKKDNYVSYTPNTFSVSNSRTTLDQLRLKLLALSLAQQQTSTRENRFFKQFIRNPLD